MSSPRRNDKTMNIEQLRKFCLAFPGATEDVKWGSDLCFYVGKKMFCVTGVDSIQPGISIKCTPEKFPELTERDGIHSGPLRCPLPLGYN